MKKKAAKLNPEEKALQELLLSLGDCYTQAIRELGENTVFARLRAILTPMAQRDLRECRYLPWTSMDLHKAVHALGFKIKLEKR